MPTTPASRSRFPAGGRDHRRVEHPGIVLVYGLYLRQRPPVLRDAICPGDSPKEAADRFHGDESLESDSRSPSLERASRCGGSPTSATLWTTPIAQRAESGHQAGQHHRRQAMARRWWSTGPGQGRGRLTRGQRRADADPRRPAVAETPPGSRPGHVGVHEPEQAEGTREHLGPRSDVYSLGRHRLLSPDRLAARRGGTSVGVIRAVQRGDFRPPRQLDPTIDRALEAVCLKAMAHRPGDRYASPKGLSGTTSSGGRPASRSRPVGESRPSGPRWWLRRHRTLMTAVAAVLIFGLAGLAVFAAVLAEKNAANCTNATAPRGACCRRSPCTRKFRDAVQGHP